MEQNKLYLWQRFLHVEIFRKDRDILEVELFFSETSREDRLWLELGIRDFVIRDVVLERPRGNGGIIKPVSLLFLKGRSIYLKEARNLKQAILEWGETRVCEPPPGVQAGAASNGDAAMADPPMPEREHFVDLFFELIANVLQAEVFVLAERGIASVADYDRYFNEMYGEMCILYTELKDKVPEYAYTQGQERYDSLFSRHRSIYIFRDDEAKKDGEKGEKLVVHGHLSDSFHEMAVSLSLSSNAGKPHVIAKGAGNFLRWPNLVCGKATVKLADLAGLQLIPDNKKELLATLTGPEGCSHMGDLVLEAAKALREMERNFV